MELIKKNEYFCAECGKKFEWNDDSWYFGKMEYQSRKDQEENQKFICSEKCKNNFQKRKNQSQIIIKNG